MFRIKILSVLVLGLSLVIIGCKTHDSEHAGETGQREQMGPLKPAPSSAVNNEHPFHDPIKYVALGDSTGVGVGARAGGYPDRLFRKIISLRPESKLVNLCVSGATSSDVLRAQLGRVADIAPDLVTLGVGINDIGHGVPIDVFERNYDQILSLLKVRTNAKLVVTNIPEISSAPRIPAFARDQYRVLITQYNQRLEEVAARHGAIIFDVHKITRDELPAHPEYFSSDGFHPSDEGYALWADSMWPTIAAVLQEGEVFS
jgi:acyl-CoA thioesterase I